MNVVYVGMARGIKTVTATEIEEIEAFFLTAYAKDQHANALSLHRGNKKLRYIRDKTNRKWK